jgi:hypothetical protein
MIDNSGINEMIHAPPEQQSVASPAPPELQFVACPAPRQQQSVACPAQQPPQQQQAPPAHRRLLHTIFIGEPLPCLHFPANQ